MPTQGNGQTLKSGKALPGPQDYNLPDVKPTNKNPDCVCCTAGCTHVSSLPDSVASFNLFGSCCILLINRTMFLLVASSLHPRQQGRRLNVQYHIPYRSCLSLVRELFNPNGAFITCWQKLLGSSCYSDTCIVAFTWANRPV